MPAIYYDSNGTEHYYVPPPPPPPPPPPRPRPTPHQVQGQVTSTQTAINYDRSMLHTLRSEVTQAGQGQQRAQEILRLEAEVRALQAQLTTNEHTLSQEQKELSHLLTVEIPRQTTQAIKTYGRAAAHAPGSPSLTTATTNLQSATFDEEVLIYEQTHGGQCWVPGSVQWQRDARSLLDDPGALQVARGGVAERHRGQLSGSGLSVAQFGVQEWAGEGVAQAQLMDPQSADGSPGKIPTLSQRANGEQAAVAALSAWLASAANSGLNPALARQALFGNSYVSTKLEQEIAHTMRGLSEGPHHTPSDGLSFLFNTLKAPTVDPQLVTLIAQEVAPTVQQYLQDLPHLSGDQAVQGYVSVAGLYYVLLNAQQAGESGAGALAGDLAQWSYAALNATSASGSNNELNTGLSGVLQKIKQQRVAPNLLSVWTGRSHEWVQGSQAGADPARAFAWTLFQIALHGDAAFTAQPLRPTSKAPLPVQVNWAQTTVSHDRSALHTAQVALAGAKHAKDPLAQILYLETQVRVAQEQLTGDEHTLTQAHTALNHYLLTQIPKQVRHAILGYGNALAHDPGAQSVSTAATALQSATFDQEVLLYEQAHGGQLWVPGSAQWQHDAQSLLGNPAALQTSWELVAVQYGKDLRTSRVSLQQFGAQLWAGAAVAQAQLADPASSAGSQSSEQAAVNALSTWLKALDGGASGGIDPALARQALLGNTYVSTTLVQQITRTIKALSGNPKTQSGGLGFLYSLLGGPNVDPQLTTVIFKAVSPTVRQQVMGLSSASTDQATQGFVYVAGLYSMLLDAQQAGVAGAGSLAQQLAQWSYTSVNSTNANASAGGRGLGFGFSGLDDVLTGNPETGASGVLAMIQQQHVSPNLMYVWQQLSSQQWRSWNSQRHFAPGPDYGVAWSRFQTALASNGALKAWPLPKKSNLIPSVPALSPNQVQRTYDTALNGVQHSGDVPPGVNPLVLAAVQTLMTGGFGGAADEGSLARSMIGADQQQLDQQWQQHNGSKGSLMPVDALTGVAGTQVQGLGPLFGLGGKSWSKAVHTAEQGMVATLPNPPSITTINKTNTAYRKLVKALASGNQGAIALAQAGWDEALALELQSVYGNRFSVNTLTTNNEYSDWYYLAQTQVLLDHATSKGMVKAVSIGLQASAIVASSVGNGLSPQQSIVSLDMDLAALQAPGADPGGAVRREVLDDGRVRSLIADQVGAATRGTASDPTAALQSAAAVLSYLEENDPSGVVTQQIVTGVLHSPAIRTILTRLHTEAAHSPDVLKLAGPLVQAAQLSPTLTLAVYAAFDFPGKAGKDNSNALVVAARSVHSAADFRNLAIIYAALPDNPQVVGLPQEVTQGQTAKAALIGALGTVLEQPKSVAAQNLKGWIQASLDGPSSAPAWLATDLLNGYQYGDRDGRTHTVGQVGSPALVTSIKQALYQPTGGSGSSSSGGFMSPVDMSAAASADGTTLQAFSSETALIGYVAQAYGLRPSSGEGASASYDPNTVVFGNTTLGQIIAGLKRQAGIRAPSADTPIVLQAAPVMIGEGQSAEFRVQRADGSIVWLGADGSVTQGWGGQNTILTRNVSTTVMQVVGGVTEANVGGAANPLLKIDTPPVTAQQQHPWWESVVEGALAMTAGLVTTALTGGNFLAGFVVAFAVEQLFDAVTNDGQMTVFQYADDLVHGKVGWKQTRQFAIDTGIEMIQAAADAAGPIAAEAASGAILVNLGSKLIPAFTPVVVDAGAEAVTAGTETAVAAGTETGTDVLSVADQKAAWIAGAKQAALKTFKGRVLASLGAAAAQGGVQGVVGLPISAINLAGKGELTWRTFGQAAAQQGLDFALSTLSGGFAGGVLSPNIVVQTVAGFATGAGQTEVDNQVFHGQNLTVDDLITAAIMTVPMTLQHYADRANGQAMIKKALRQRSASHPQPSQESSPEAQPAPTRRAPILLEGWNPTSAQFRGWLGQVGAAGGASGGGDPPRVPPTGGTDGQPGPDDGSNTPVYFVHKGADGKVSVWLGHESGPTAVDNPSAPWGGGVPPEALRVIQIAEPNPRDPEVIAFIDLTRTKDGRYDRQRMGTSDGTVTWDTTSANNPFGVNLPALREAPPSRPLVSRAKKVGQGVHRVVLIPTVDWRSLLNPKAYAATIGKLFTHTAKEAGVRIYAATRNKPLLNYPATVPREIRKAGFFQVYDDPTTGEHIPISRVHTYRDPGLSPRGPVISVPTHENPANAGEWIPTYIDATTKQPIPVTVEPGGRRVIAGGIDPATGQPHVIAYADPETGSWYLAANTWPDTGEPRVIPDGEHGDRTLAVTDASSPSVQTDWPKPVRGLLGMVTPRYAETTERTVREIALLLTELHRITFLNEKFNAPGGAASGKLTALGAAVRALIDARSSWSDTDVNTVVDYVTASLRSVDPSVRVAVRDALLDASPSGIGDLLAAYRAAYGRKAPSDVSALSKVDINTIWRTKDVYRLIWFIDKSLHSDNPTIQAAARNIVRSLTDSDLSGILLADYDSKYTGSKTAGELSGNTVATLELIFDTGGPGILRRVYETAPDLVTQVEQTYFGLQARGLKDEHATGIVTKPAYDAINALLKAAARSTDRALVAAAAKAREALGGLKPGEHYTQAQLDAFVEFMKADQETTWIGGFGIIGSLRGKISVQTAVIGVYLEDPEWTRDSVRVWNAYMSALRDSPDPQMRRAWADAVSKLELGEIPWPKAGQQISQEQREVWFEVGKGLFEADAASWWKPRMVLVDNPTLSRAANSVLLQDFAIHGQNPTNAYGDMLLGYVEDVVGASKRVWHSFTPITSNLATGLSFIGLPLLNGYYEADLAANPDFFIPVDTNSPHQEYRANMWYDPSKGHGKKPYVLGADLTLYVQPHMEFRWGPVFTGHFHFLPFSAFIRGVHNRVEYVGVDAEGNAGHQVIARGTRLTRREAQFLEQLVRFGRTPLSKAGHAPTDTELVFGAYATEPAWRWLTTPLLYKLGLSKTGPDWWRANAFGRRLGLPTPEYDTIQLELWRFDVGAEAGFGVTVLPVAGRKSIRAVGYQPEFAVTPKVLRPMDIRFNKARWETAQEHQVEAQRGLQALANTLEAVAAEQGGGGGQWPGSDQGQRAFAAIRAAGLNLSPKTTKELIVAMRALREESGASLPPDVRSALGNQFWAPGKIWRPDQVTAAIALFYADLGLPPPTQELPPPSPPQLPPGPGNTGGQPFSPTQGWRVTQSPFRQWLSEIERRAADERAQSAAHHSISSAGNPNPTPTSGSAPQFDAAALLAQARATPALDPLVVRRAVDRYFAGPSSAAGGAPPAMTRPTVVYTPTRISAADWASMRLAFAALVAQYADPAPARTLESSRPTAERLEAMNASLRDFLAQGGAPSATGAQPPTSAVATASSPTAPPPTAPTPPDPAAQPVPTPDAQVAAAGKPRKLRLGRIPKVRRDLAAFNDDGVTATGSTAIAVLARATTRFNSRGAGYSKDLRGALTTYLRSLPARERMTLVRVLKNLPANQHTQIQALLSAVDPLLDKSLYGLDTLVQARLVAQIASLSGDERARALPNITRLPTDPTQSGDFARLVQFLHAAPDRYNPQIRARRALFLLSFEGAARPRAIELLTTIEKFESASRKAPLSPGQMDSLGDAVTSLVALAADNRVPAVLSQLVDPVPASSLQAALQAMTSGGARELASRSSYDAATTRFVELLNSVANSSTANVRLVIETGARGLDASGDVKPSVYGGIVGTALFIRYLRAGLAAVPEYRNVTLDVTVVTDSSSEPVIRGLFTDRFFGLSDVNVREAPSGGARTDLLNTLHPTAVLSFGQSTEHGGAESLLEPAKGLGVPTFAIGDNTDASITFRLNTADRAMVAGNADVGVGGFIAHVLAAMGADRGRSPILRRSRDLGLLKFLQLEDVRKAYANITADRAAIFDDARYGATAKPGTLSADALVGMWNLLFYSLAPGAESVPDPAREPTGRDLLAARYPVVLRAREQTPQAVLESYRDFFLRAQPAQGFLDQLASMPFVLSQASRGEQIRRGAGAAASIGASIVVATQFGTHDPAMMDTITALGAFATSVRQYWIFKVAGMERLQGILRIGPRQPRRKDAAEPTDLRQLPLSGLPVIKQLNDVLQRSVATDAASQARVHRRRYLFNMVGAHTYDLSILTVASQAASAAVNLHGWTLYTLQSANSLTAAGLVLVYALYGRNLLTPRLGADGKLYADPTFDSKPLNTTVDIARIPLGLGGLANIIELGAFNRPAFTAYTGTDVVANYARNWTSVDKALGVWARQRRLKGRGLDVMGKGYEWWDLMMATWPGNTGTILVNLWGELTLAHEGLTEFDSAALKAIEALARESR